MFGLDKKINGMFHFNEDILEDMVKEGYVIMDDSQKELSKEEIENIIRKQKESTNE